ncbi:hypothetical protein E3J51_00790 [Candidatus Bathyarchaeota archaeon]|nr:MAG: hypothetical protein E3J51_00790 [Candidatus Bathyarchaeota archaeon]
MSHSEERGFRDRDFLSTMEGFFFCVVGPYHPSDRVISYLKYLPDQSGGWGKGNDRFKRVMRAYTVPNLLETLSLLKSTHPQYLFYSSAYNITMSAVPLRYLVTHFKPEEKLTELLEAPLLDSLQEKAVRLVSLLSELAEIPIGCFGVTGSILLGIHDLSFSDMDIVVYGMECSYTLKNALADSTVGTLRMRPLSGDGLRQWCLQKARNHPISVDDAERIYGRKWNIGTFDGTFFSLHSVKLGGELTEMYGDRIYEPDRIVSLTAVVEDCKDSIFLPSVYRVGSVEVEGVPEASVREVVSYEGLYDSLADEGEMIAVKGKLEHVYDKRTGESYDRVLVGSPEGKGREYIKPVS